MRFDRNDIERYAPSSPQKANKSILKTNFDRLHILHLIKYGIKYIKYVCNSCGFTSMSKRTKEEDQYKKQ